MTTTSDDALPTLRCEVERLLGRCLVRLQLFEGLLKAIVAEHEISGPAHALEAVREARIADTSNKTLGALIGEFLGSYLVKGENGAPSAAATSSSEDVASIGFRISRGLSEAEFARTEKELRELVLMRNSMVHHFINQYDLRSLDGCRAATEALKANYRRIDRHLGQLREWAEHIMRVRTLALRLFQSDEVRKLLVDDDGPEGTVDEPDTGIVHALREAAGELAVDGWTPVDQAGKWISKRDPKQNPARYGCGSWRQVVHQSRPFELRYREIDGRRSACYREHAARFVASGTAELGATLGPVHWQPAPTKTWCRDDMTAFLNLAPVRAGERPLRHAGEARHGSVADGGFAELAPERRGGGTGPWAGSTCISTSSAGAGP